MKEKNLSTRSYIARDDDEDQPGDPLSIIMLIIARYKDYLSKTFDIICQKLLYSNQYKFNYINVIYLFAFHYGKLFQSCFFLGTIFYSSIIYLIQSKLTVVS